MSVDANKWFVIVNPVAGGGRGLDHFPQISRYLREAHILCEPVFTEHKFHATELTVTAVREGYRRIIVVGGDGTLHEVVNGLFIQLATRRKKRQQPGIQSIKQSRFRKFFTWHTRIPDITGTEPGTQQK